MKSIINVLIILSFSITIHSCGYFDGKKENIPQESKLYIPTNATLQQVLDSIKPLVNDFESFQKTVKSKGLQKIYPGRYTLLANETNASIVEKLQLGKQDEIEIMIGNYSSVYELANKLDPFLEVSAEALLQAIAARPEVQSIDTLKWIYFLAPNTHRFHWASPAPDIIEKIAKPYQQFWNAERKQLLTASGMTELEVVSLASVVQLESYKQDEQPKVAGLYLNRLKIGMKLDADPTVIFAKKIKEGWDKKIQRVYYKDLNNPSPYNTYQHKGIPPGPICMPNPSAIDAVLKPENHDYIFFVADPSRPGYHLYAKTLAEQERNADIYRKWADENKIK